MERVCHDQQPNPNFGWRAQRKVITSSHHIALHILEAANARASRTRSRMALRNRDGAVEGHTGLQGTRREEVGKVPREADHEGHRGVEESDSDPDNSHLGEEVCDAGSRRDVGNSRVVAAPDGHSIRFPQEGTHILDEVENENVHNHDRIEEPPLGAVIMLGEDYYGIGRR